MRQTPPQGPQSYSRDELQAYFGSPAHRHHGAEEHQRFEANQQALMAVAAVAGLIAFVTLALTIYLAILVNGLPSLEALQKPKLNLASTALTADGQELTRYLEDNRKWVTLDEVSPRVVEALIATEDHRFYDHWGIDLQRTFAVPVHFLRGSRQGGSTITQQLARNLYEQVGRENSVARKLREMMTAIELERHYTKEEIIELYLNTMEYVYLAHGIEAASRTYFNKHPRDLSLLESATLIGMLQNPSLHNPVPALLAPENERNQRKKELTRQRRNVVMRQMVKHGFLTQEDYESVRDEPVTVDFNPATRYSGPSPYFAEYVRQWLTEWSEESGYDIYRDGLVIHTTLDSKLQAAADSAVSFQAGNLQAVADVEWSSRPRGYGSPSQYRTYRDANNITGFDQFWKTKTDMVNSFIRQSQVYQTAIANGERPATALARLRENTAYMDSLRIEKTRLEAGFVAMDPRNGHIKAWVGGRDFSLDQYDHVNIAKRQPGSTFKPFVYTAALDNGFSPYYTLRDSAKTLNCEGARGWRPRNSGSGGSGRWMTLKTGLQKSVNTVTAELACKVGSRVFVQYAIDMGVDQSIKIDQAVPAASLGTIEATLLEMATGYSTLANGGYRRRPLPVTRIEDRYGNIIEEFQTNSKEVLNPNTAYTVVDIMRGVITGGTGTRIGSVFGIREDVAGKTGTTQENSDGWFMMMYPELVMGSWVGFNDRRVTFRSMNWGQGGHSALYIVGDFMRRALQSGAINKGRRFERPPNYKEPAQLVPREGGGSDRDGGTRETTPPPAAPEREQRRFDW